MIQSYVNKRLYMQIPLDTPLSLEQRWLKVYVPERYLSKTGKPTFVLHVCLVYSQHCSEGERWRWGEGKKGETMSKIYVILDQAPWYVG